MDYPFNFTEDDYSTDYDDEVCEKAEVVKFGSIIVPVFFTIVITLSLTGNILVLVILALYENLKSLTNIFIVNLAISDLMVCKIVTFIFFTGFYSSVLFLTIMTIYRYLVVVHPLSDMSSLKPWTGFFLSVLTWIISIGAAMPSLLQTSLVSVHHKDTHSLGCELNMPGQVIGIYQQNVFFLIAFSIMAFCYIQILRRITGTRSRTKNKAVKLVFCIVAVFFVGWVPYNVVIFLKFLVLKVQTFDDCAASIRLDYAFFVCRLIAFSHCCLNPVFYAFVGVKFRNHLKSLLHRMFKHPIPVDTEVVRMQNLMSRGSLY
uniref:X-C motif chemokine receptor 1 n=1 Tax=Fundulus heteroclitus TaxID=8078 RepID=A0A3Q2R2K9_FUNHE